jgi:hypothetical protein
MNAGRPGDNDHGASSNRERSLRSSGQPHAGRPGEVYADAVKDTERMRRETQARSHMLTSGEKKLLDQ